MPNLGNAPGIDTLIGDGKVYRSIDDAVALTRENNLHLDIARCHLNIADTDYLPAQSPPTSSACLIVARRQDTSPAGSVGQQSATIGIAPIRSPFAPAREMLCR